MDKKLIKQLKSVGFENLGSWYSLFIGNNEINYYHYLRTFAIVNKATQERITPRIVEPTFEQITKAIKDVTGIDARQDTGGGTSDARFMQRICPVFEFGTINKTLHKVDECVSIEDLKTTEKKSKRQLFCLTKCDCFA